MDDLDPLIDEAARQIAQYEPPDALSDAVMQRISTGEPRASHRWLALGSLAAVVAVAGVVMFVGRTETAPAQKAQGSGFAAQGEMAQGSRLKFQRDEQAQGSRLKAQGTDTAQGSRFKAQGGNGAQGRPVEWVVDEPSQFADPIILETIASEPIAVASLEVTTLKAIDVIEIAPIAVSPISTSDD